MQLLASLGQQFACKTLLSFKCSCVEIGSGSGYVSCSLALLLEHHKCNAVCLVTDISPHAVAATQDTLAAHQVQQHFLCQSRLAMMLTEI